MTRAQRAGKSYERKVHARYLPLYRGYLPGLWFHFLCSGDHRRRWCQPDALHIDLERGHIQVIEVKIRHTAEAWWQLHKLYLPVVQAYFGDAFSYSTLEIVRWFDPKTAYPVEPSLVGDPFSVRTLDVFPVHVCVV